MLVLHSSPRTSWHSEKQQLKLETAQSNQSLHYAPAQCGFVGESPEGDNRSRSAPPADSAEERQGGTAVKMDED